MHVQLTETRDGWQGHTFSAERGQSLKSWSAQASQTLALTDLLFSHLELFNLREIRHEQKETTVQTNPTKPDGYLLVLRESSVDGAWTAEIPGQGFETQRGTRDKALAALVLRCGHLFGIRSLAIQSFPEMGKPAKAERHLLEYSAQGRVTERVFPIQRFHAYGPTLEVRQGKTQWQATLYPPEGSRPSDHQILRGPTGPTAEAALGSFLKKHGPVLGFAATPELPAPTVAQEFLNQLQTQSFGLAQIQIQNPLPQTNPKEKVTKTGHLEP